jgi:hypothetical protein
LLPELLSTGAKIGIGAGIGGGVLLVLIIIFIILCLRSHDSKLHDSKSDDSKPPDSENKHEQDPKSKNPGVDPENDQNQETKHDSKQLDSKSDDSIRHELNSTILNLLNLNRTISSTDLNILIKCLKNLILYSKICKN